MVLELTDSGFLEVVDVEYEDLKVAKEIAVKYKLLSNDAIIVAVAINRGIIKKVVTFDDDFKRD